MDNVQPIHYTHDIFHIIQLVAYAKNTKIFYRIQDTMTTFLKKEADTERYTPPEVVAAVKDTLGQIDLDPATTTLVNSTFIRAKKYYTELDDGLDRENNSWGGKVYINPPNNLHRGDNTDRPRMFWERLMIEYQAKRVTAAVFLAFNIEFLQRSQNWNHAMVHYPFCIPSKQLIFYREKNGVIKPGDYPEFASAIVYIGNNVGRFSKAFANIGAVVIPRSIPRNKSNEQNTNMG